MKKIKQISVTGLLGTFNHTISLNRSDRITLIYGPNGIGKTSILKMLNDLFNFHHLEFCKNQFQELKIEFNNHTSLQVTKPEATNYNCDQLKFSLFKHKNEYQVFTYTNFLDYQADFFTEIKINFMKFYPLSLPDFRTVDSHSSNFHEIANKINLFETLIKQRLHYKKISLGKGKGLIFTTFEDKILSIQDLTLAEQRQLVIVYMLLFKIKPHSLIIIDEPESSLPWEWQGLFLQDLQAIIKLANFEAIIATESSHIISDRPDLVVELKWPK